MKLAIITWCNYHNFGTYLQAYALQTFLKKNGFTVNILDDYQYSVKQPFFVAFKIAIKNFIKRLFFQSHLKDDKLDALSGKLYESFKQIFLKVDSNVKPLNKIDERYDAYVCGSDQIWNPGGFIRKGNDFYFASFANKTKVAYAPSIGVKEIPKEYKEHYSKLISDFAFLSTREQSASELLRNLCGKVVETVVDPTLLMRREDWFQLVAPAKVAQSYIFVYLLTYNQSYIERIYEYSGKHNLKVRIVKPCGVKIPIEGVEPAGPLEFIKLISEASIVMTDSFHAVLFSLIYRKQFVVFKRFKDTNKASQNSRIENLLSRINLLDSFIDESNLNQLAGEYKFDFDDIDKNLAPFIDKSKDYLLNALRIIKNERS